MLILTGVGCSTSLKHKTCDHDVVGSIRLPDIFYLLFLAFLNLSLVALKRVPLRIFHKKKWLSKQVKNAHRNGQPRPLLHLFSCFSPSAIELGLYRPEAAALSTRQPPRPQWLKKLTS